MIPRSTAIPILAAFQIAACASAMPGQRPADLTVILYRGTTHPDTGMPVHDELVLSASETAHYRVDYEGGGAISVPLSVHEADLDDLYVVLRENDFDKMGPDKASAKKTKGIWVVVSFGGFSWTASSKSGGTTAQWKQVLSTIMGMKKKYVDEAGVDIPEQFDDTIFGVGYPEKKPGSD